MGTGNTLSILRPYRFQRMFRRHWLLFLAFGVLCLSTAIAFWPTFVDERILLDWATTASWERILGSTHIKFPHYPPYYLIVKSWGSVFPVETVRFFSVACSLGTVALTYRIAAVRYGRRLAGLAAMLLALSPVFAVQSHWIRPYPLFGLLITAAWWLLLTDDANSWRWPAWAALSVAIIWMHLFGVVFVFGMGLWILCSGNRPWKSLIVVGANAAASGVLIFGRVDPTGTLNTGGRNIHVVYPPGMVDVILMPGALAVGGVMNITQLAILAGITAAIIYGIVRTDIGGAVGCWAVIPIVLVAIGSYIEPVYQLKYFGILAPAISLILARSLVHIGRSYTGMLFMTVFATQIPIRLSELVFETRDAAWMAFYLFRPW